MAWFLSLSLSPASCFQSRRPTREATLDLANQHVFHDYPLVLSGSCADLKRVLRVFGSYHNPSKSVRQSERSNNIMTRPVYNARSNAQIISAFFSSCTQQPPASALPFPHRFPTVYFPPLHKR